MLQADILFHTVVCAVLVFQSPLTAEQAKVNPVGFIEKSEEVVSRAYDEWGQATKLINESTNDIRRLKKPAFILGKLGEAHVRVRNLQRLAGIAGQMREPAALDLRMRFEQLIQELKLIQKSDPRLFGVIANLAKANYQADRGNISKSLARLERLYNSSKFEKAEAELVVFLDRIHKYSFFLPTKHQTGLSSLIFPTRRKISDINNQSRKEKYLKQISAELESSLPTVSKIEDLLDQAIQQIAQTGKANFGSKTYSGPETLGLFVKQIFKVNLQLVRCHGIAAALGDRAREEEIEKSIDQLHQLLISRTPELILAHAEIIDPADVESAYVEYLSKTVQAFKRVASSTWYDSIENAIQELASKSVEFSESLGNYKESTSDLLYWRAKVADSQRENLLPHYAKLAQFLNEKIGFNDDNKNGLKTLDFAGRSMPTELANPLNQVENSANSRVQDQYVLINNAVKNGDSMISGIHDRYWVTAPVDFSVKQEIEKLKKDLFVTSEKKPLTMEAATSLASAVLGNFDEMGGKITNLSLESATVRLWKITSKTGILTPIGRKIENLHSNQMFGKIQLKSDWVKHRHFFVDLYQNNQISSLDVNSE